MRWQAKDLYAQAKEEKAKPYRLPLKHIDLSVVRHPGERILDQAHHCMRTMNTDPDIPVLVGPAGGIMDGWHRVIRALLEGRTYVMALRLKELPPGEEIKDTEEEA
jgi:hypothetical protein